MSVKKIIKLFLPPIITRFLRYLAKRSTSSTQNKNNITLNELKLKYSLEERFQEFKGIEIDGIKFDIPDFPSFYYQLEDILLHEEYNLPLDDKKELTIYDCGANVGTVTLFLKKKYPNARIKCFEADPKLVEYLSKNLEQNKSLNHNVEIIPKAVWKDENGISFNSEGADGGSIFNKSTISNKLVKVPTVRLADFIKNETKIDLLKIDIEGAEGEVIKDCSDYLSKVKYFIFEYHAVQGKVNDLGAILSVLEKNKFRYFIKNLTEIGPFLLHDWNKPRSNHLDMQLLVFAFNTLLV